MEIIRTAAHTALAYGWWGYVALWSRLRLGAAVGSAPRSRRMLLLAWRLPPSVTGGVYRPCSFLKYGPPNGWEISAIAGPPELTADEPGKWLLERLPRSTKIHRSSVSSLRPGWNWFPRVDGGFLNALAVATLAYRKFKGRPPSVVTASGPPFHNFIAAYYIARYYKAKLVLDYRDEWSVGTRDFIRLGNADRKWESLCLKKADAVVFVTKSFKDIYLQHYTELDPDKTHVVTNGWDSDDFSAAGELPGSAPQCGNRYTISFIGRTGKFLAPDSFLSTLDQLLKERPALREQLRVRFVGRQFPDVRETLERFHDTWPDVLETMGEVTKPAALRAMKESFCLLLLNNTANERVRAGKIYEYLAAGPPLLVYGKGRETEELVRRLNAGPVVPEDQPDALHRALSDLIEGKWAGRNRSEIDEWLARHTRETLTKRLFAIVDGMLDNSQEDLSPRTQ